MGYRPTKAPTGNSDLLCRFLAVSDSRTVASKHGEAAAISTSRKSAEPNEYIVSGRLPGRVHCAGLHLCVCARVHPNLNHNRELQND